MTAKKSSESPAPCYQCQVEVISDVRLVCNAREAHIYCVCDDPQCQKGFRKTCDAVFSAADARMKKSRQDLARKHGRGTCPDPNCCQHLTERRGFLTPEQRKQLEQKEKEEKEQEEVRQPKYKNRSRTATEETQPLPLVDDDLLVIPEKNDSADDLIVGVFKTKDKKAKKKDSSKGKVKTTIPVEPPSSLLKNEQGELLSREAGQLNAWVNGSTTISQTQHKPTRINQKEDFPEIAPPPPSRGPPQGDLTASDSPSESRRSTKRQISSTASTPSNAPPSTRTATPPTAPPPAKSPVVPSVPPPVSSILRRPESPELTGVPLISTLGTAVVPDVRAPPPVKPPPVVDLPRLDADDLLELNGMAHLPQDLLDFDLGEGAIFEDDNTAVHPSVIGQSPLRSGPLGGLGCEPTHVAEAEFATVLSDLRECQARERQAELQHQQDQTELRRTRDNLRSVMRERDNALDEVNRLAEEVRTLRAAVREVQVNTRVVAIQTWPDAPAGYLPIVLGGVYEVQHVETEAGVVWLYGHESKPQPRAGWFPASVVHPVKERN
mmetsp:Transcript_31994/g.76735  ORF Transcript_31994/g.76735 Transcript_31994/m.76735 type:complete len:550 (+) Transcript_31994:149-1798(+)